MPDLPQDVNVNVRDIDPQRKDPPWLRILGAASSFGIICCVFVWLIVKVVNAQDDNVKLYENLLIRTDKMLEGHDNRVRDWMKGIGERNGLEHEKTRLELKNLADQVKLLRDTLGMKMN